jgi:gamma-glutamyl:cysteine ligase YbdK (ATP-grasp superfamily)
LKTELETTAEMDYKHGSRRYKTLELFGPEHEFSIVDEELKPMPVVDMVIKKLCGRIKNNVYLPDFIFSNELQKHVAEFKGITPFRSSFHFEETMQRAILEISDILDGLKMKLLGTGMHPTLTLDEVEVWDHRNKQIYDALHRVFNLKQHGWLNIQSYQLNLSYYNEQEAVKLYNCLTGILPYIPAISASSPIYDSKVGKFVDNRLHFYGINQVKIPSIMGDIIPKPIDSFETYRNLTIRKYSADLIHANASACIINKEWLNSRSEIFRFDRKAIEIRVMDEQECIKSDVALSSFIRALLRGLMEREDVIYPHRLLVTDFHAVIRDGLDAKVSHPEASTARDLCRRLLKIAYDQALEEERKYLWIIKKRVEEGSLSETIANHVQKRAQRTDFQEAVLNVYSELAEKLRKNEIYG